MWWRHNKFYRHAKAKRVQHHQTKHTMYAKENSLGQKEKTTTRNKKKHCEMKKFIGRSKHIMKVGNHEVSREVKKQK